MADSDITWQEAVARLARERTQAEMCVGILKKYGDTAAVARGLVSYDEAKAEYDGVIAGLIVVLAQKQKPASLEDLQVRLQRGFAKREAFCNSVKPLLPKASGEKNLIVDIVKGAVEPIINAIKEIYFRAKDDNALTRKTIETQLKAASWRDFAAIKAVDR